MKKSSPHLRVLELTEVPGYSRVFALGNFARQVTFTSQQIRAFNLVWALFKAKRLKKGQRVAVIGAGLGGLTTAVAALMKECHVDLFEQAGQHCPLQRGNDLRYIHPNILRWPEDGCDVSNSELPALNWTAANVRGVIHQIDVQWKRIAGENPLLSTYFNYRVDPLNVKGGAAKQRAVWLTANRLLDGVVPAGGKGSGLPAGFVEKEYDCIVLAVGFGDERSMAGIPFLSYWHNDSLHQEVVRDRRNILVTGCGDGGLIDALRLRLRNFDHAEFVRKFLETVDAASTVAALKRIDDDLRPIADAPDISLRFRSAYDGVPVPKRMEEHFVAERRTDTHVTLNSTGPGPLTFTSSLLNRYATYLAMRYADLHYRQGSVGADGVSGSRWRVRFTRGATGAHETHEFDQVIVRHGPQGAIDGVVPSAAVAELKESWRNLDDPTTTAHWRLDDRGQPHGFFRGFTSDTVLPPRESKELALTTFDSAYRELIRDPDAIAVAVGEHDAKAGFIVTLKPGSAPRQSRFFAGVLVQFVGAAPTAVPAPPVAAGRRRLRAGVGIYNYDVQQRLRAATELPAGDGSTPTPDPGAARRSVVPSSLGTAGFFATDAAGRRHVVTTAHVLSPRGAALAGDRVFLEGESPEEGHQPVATMATWILPMMDPAMDVAAARLLDDVDADYEALPIKWRPRRVGSAKPRVLVAKVARTSGLTYGMVTTSNALARVTMSDAEHHWFKDCVFIEGAGGSFSMPGDSGALIVDVRGNAVGMLIARSSGGDAEETIACSLAGALRVLDMKLLPAS